MRDLRAFITIACFAGFTAVLYCGLLLSRALLAPAPRWKHGARRAITRAWARGVARIFRMRIVIEGSPPKPPFFLVSNHLGYMDVVAYLACVDGTFLAKSEIASWPVFGRLARGVGTLFIERDRKRELPRATRRLADALAAGRNVIVFPEGTSSPGDEVLPFRAPTFETAVQLGLPVHVAAIRYETPADAPPARTAVCWWGDMALWPHLRDLAALRGFTARIRFDATPVVAANRKELAVATHARISARKAG